MPLTAMAGLVAACIFAPVLVADPRAWSARGVAAVTLLAAFALAWRVPVVEMGKHMDVLTAQRRSSGDDSFSLRDRLGLWGLNVCMVTGAYVWGLPEVGREAWRLGLPGDGRKRVWSSDFAMRSPRVRAALRDMIAELDTVESSEAVLHRTVVWTGSYRNAANDDSLRAALALNCPLELTLEARYLTSRWRIDAEAACRVEYPREHRVILYDDLRGREIAIDEGNFAVLQRTGWMTPYDAVWEWSFPSDDPRLTEEAPTLSLRERLLRRLWLGKSAS